MGLTISIDAVLASKKQCRFDDVAVDRPHKREVSGVTLVIGEGFPIPVTVIPPSADDPVRSVEYRMSSDMRNYHRPIVPDSDRWFAFQMQMVSFWRHKSESSVNDVKTPLFMFAGQDQNVALAFGVVGRNYETEFKILEPRRNRALICYMRRLTVEIKRGTDLYPIPDSVRGEKPDGSVTEHLFLRTYADTTGKPWMLVLREFSGHQKSFYGIPDVTTRSAMAPLWCSWTDWMSNDVTDKVVLENVREGVRMGIRNYIVDDGWFGPGLDNEYDVELNIGDWEPEPPRFPDMKGLVRRIRDEGDGGYRRVTHREMGF